MADEKSDKKPVEKSGGKSILKRLNEESTFDVMELIYEQVNKLFGAGNQLFSMEFPTRSLNYSDYEYNIENCYSSLSKPYPVQEAEFKLSDQLFDHQEIVQGSNGESLSSVYNTILNNLVPKLGDLKDFVSDKQKLREWLLKNVNADGIGGKDTLSRMAISEELYNKYLEKENEWNKEKNKTYDEYKAKDKLDEYAKWVSTEGRIKEEMINNYYNDAVVRGNYHEVLTMLGFLNVSSPAELLEKTKQNMRGCVRRSLDGSSDVYTVSFQPSNWFKSLKPNLSPKDLVMSKDALTEEYLSKKKAINNLSAQLNDIDLKSTQSKSRDDLEKEIDDLEAKILNAENGIVKQCGEGAVSAFKTILNIYKNVADPIGKTSVALKQIENGLKNPESMTDSLNSVYLLLEDASVESVKSVCQKYETQGNLTKDMEKLSKLKLALLESNNSDVSLMKNKIKMQISNLQSDIDFLKPLVEGVIGIEAEGSNEKPSELLPESDADDFTDIIIKQEEVKAQSNIENRNKVFNKDTRVAGWFSSYENKETGAESKNNLLETNENLDLQIGLRVKKVSFDRGGWFNPTIFKMSKSYYHLTDMKGLLPSFPTGFVVAKDITIKFKTDKQNSESCKEYMESNNTSNGGILGFRCSNSNSSKSVNETAYSGVSGAYFYIRIPGPQIIGWFQQDTADDVSESYKAMDSNMYTDMINDLTGQE